MSPRYSTRNKADVKAGEPAKAAAVRELFTCRHVSTSLHRTTISFKIANDQRLLCPAVNVKAPVRSSQVPSTSSIVAMSLPAVPISTCVPLENDASYNPVKMPPELSAEELTRAYP